MALRKIRVQGDPVLEKVSKEVTDLNFRTKLLIEGEVRNNNYTNKDGQKVYGTQILVNAFEFCESKGTGGNEVPTFKPNADGFISIPDGIEEELPFN